MAQESNSEFMALFEVPKHLIKYVQSTASAFDFPYIEGFLQDGHGDGFLKRHSEGSIQTPKSRLRDLSSRGQVAKVHVGCLIMLNSYLTSRLRILPISQHAPDQCLKKKPLRHKSSCPFCLFRIDTQKVRQVTTPYSECLRSPCGLHSIFFSSSDKKSMFPSFPDLKT